MRCGNCQKVTVPCSCILFFAFALDALDSFLEFLGPFIDPFLHFRLLALPDLEGMVRHPLPAPDSIARKWASGKQLTCGWDQIAVIGVGFA